MSDTSRRRFLEHLGVAATMGLFARAGVAHASSGAVPAGLTDDEAFLWRILEGIDVGAPFHEDWVLLDAYPPMAGGVPLVISQGAGDPLRVDVVRRSDPVRAPAATAHLELYAMDGGGGVKLMSDALVDAMQALAAKLQDNVAQHRLAARLLTHGERIRRYPGFMERAAAELAPQAPAED